MSIAIPFTEKELDNARESWGANCGPSALAFALQCNIDAVKEAIPDFARKGYTSPTMMAQALNNLGYTYAIRPANIESAFRPNPIISLVRVQWTGPWTAPNANPRWAYCYTHWIAAFIHAGRFCVFDCNSGAETLEEWKSQTVPFILSHVKRADGWRVSHVWTPAKTKQV